MTVMQLTHTFELPAPADRVFAVFRQLDLLAPSFPGASVWGRDGDVYHGAVTIRFGPFPLVFEGTARVVQVDLSGPQMLVKAHARDRRGAAAGAAIVTAAFRPAQPNTTRVEVSTDLELTGRPSRLGSGAISSVSDRLKDQFVDTMSDRLAAGLIAEEPGTSAAGRSYTPPSQPGSAAHLQVLPAVARTWLPFGIGALGGLALLMLLVRSLRRRSSSFVR